MSSDATSSFDRFVLGAIHVGERLVRAWKALSAKRRLAAYAAFGLFVGLFLPWYSQTVVAGRPAQPRSVSLNGWDAFSLVPTMVLLVSIGVLVLLYERGNGRAFRLPGGDGGAILAAGCVTFVLAVIGIFDRPGASGRGEITTATGVQWGIFIVLLLAALLAYAGSQIRLESPRERHGRPERAPAPPVDDATRVSKRPRFDQPTPVSNRRVPVDTPTKISTRRRPRPPADDETKESPTRIGDPVVPEDPPTLQLRRAKPPKPFRAEDPHPPDGWSTNEK